jgi:hypothetical protein
MFIDKLTDILGWESFHAKECSIQPGTFPEQISCHKLFKLNADAQVLDKIYVSWLVDQYYNKNNDGL